MSYTSRIALIEPRRNWKYSGQTTFVYSMLQTCERAGILVDIFTDGSLRDRARYMPAEIYAAVAPHTRSLHWHGKQATSARASKFNTLEKGLAINSFFHALGECVYDAVIVNEATLAWDLLMSGYDGNLYLYLHQHELFMPWQATNVVSQWMREALWRGLPKAPLAGMLVQHEANVGRVQAAFLDKVNVSVVPIPVTDFTPDYSGQRSGIVYFGAGDEIKNPEMAIEVMAQLPDHPAYFYAGRGEGRLLSEMKKRDLIGVVRSKLTRTQLAEEFSKRRLGIFTSHCEGYGLAIIEQMCFFPVLIRADVPYAEFFPTAIKFDSVSDAREKAQVLLEDDEAWAAAVEANRLFLLTEQSVEKAMGAYVRLCHAVPRKPTDTSRKVARWVAKEKRLTYEAVLQRLNWKDTLWAQKSVLSWPLPRFNYKFGTYFGKPL